MSSAPTNPGLEIKLFGPFAVRLNGEPLPPLRTRKGQWLLALLALRRGRDVDRRWLAGTLWPESDESQSLYNLRRSLSDLRNALGNQADCLLTPTSQTLRLDLPQEAVDLWMFDAAIAKGDCASLDSAISLYAGNLMEGCTEEWAIPEVETRERAFLHALETRTNLALAQNDLEHAEVLARRAISIDSSNEVSWRLLFTALARRGQFAALTMAYRELRLGLLRDLNVLPDAQTSALYDKLRTEAKRASSSKKLSSTLLLPETTPPSSPGSRPRSITPLIGRETHITAGKLALNSARLFTLTGAGGVGKTRLSLGIADAVSDEYADGVWFVDLSTITDPLLVPRQVAAVLKVPEESGDAIQTDLCRALEKSQMVLILDNCEHLLDACALLAETLLECTENLRILATSRIPLGVMGEVTWRVPSLTVPPKRMLPARPQVAGLMTYAAVQLFVERVTQHQSSFRLDAENSDAVIEICRRLDGIPLALELAAARTRHLSVTEIARRLDNVIALLTGGSRTALPRKQTLRASIDWSWSLLNEAERTLLARLSVFAGGFTLEAVQAVCNTPLSETADQPCVPSLPELQELETLDLLASLVDNSLVNYSDTEDEDRYRLPEPIRQYAAEQLATMGSGTILRQLHADYYRRFAETARQQIDNGGPLPFWLHAFDREHDNLRLVFDWFERSEIASMESGLRFAGAMQTFWLTRGHYSEGRRRLMHLLRRTESEVPSVERAFVLNGAGRMALYQADRKSAQTLHLQALDIYRNQQDWQGLGETLNYLGQVARQDEQYAIAEDYFHQAMTTLKAEPLSATFALALYNLGTIYYRTERYAEASSHYRQALEAFEAQGNRHQRILPLFGLAHVLRKEDRVEEARHLATEALSGCQEIGDIYYMLFALELVGQIACDRHAMRLATQLIGAAEALRERLGNRPTKAQQEELNKLRDQLRQSLGEPKFETALAEGRKLSMAQAVDLATSSGEGPAY